MTQKVCFYNLFHWHATFYIKTFVLLTPKPSLAVCLKVEELKETVKEEFMPWVSQYLVMKRVSIEPNFHSLYSNFLDTLKNPEFVKMVLNETYRNIKVNKSSRTYN